MKLNISNPGTGGQKLIEVEDETKLRAFYDKRISHEVEGDVLGPEFKGYIFRISGGNDKQGFPMLQGVITPQRVRLLFSKGMPCYRPRKRGERKRKSIRRCIVSSDLAVLSLVIVKKGEKDIAGLTDVVKPRRLGPKRATRIRKLFNLDKKDDVRQYVIRRQIVKEGKKPTTKAPKIQRLVTPQRLQHKRERKAIKKQRFEKSKKEAEEYNTLVAKRVKESREKRKAVVAKKRSISRAQSGKEETPDKKDKKQTQKPAKKEEKKTDKPATVHPPKGGAAPAQKGGDKPAPKASDKTQPPAKGGDPAKAVDKKATGKPVKTGVPIPATAPLEQKPAQKPAQKPGGEGAPDASKKKKKKGKGGK